MSVLDRLIVELQLDPRKFSGPTKKAVEDLRTFEKQAENTGNGLDSAGKKGADAIAGVRREFVAMFAVFTAGKSLKAFVSDTTKANMQLDYMSQRLNMDPAGLTRLETAAKAAGGTFGEVTQSFAALQQRLTDPQQWAQVTRAFTQLGVTDFADEHGRIRSDIIARLNRGIHANHVDNAVATGYLKDLGFGDGVINQALMDPGKFQNLQRDASKVPTLTRQELENSRELYQSLTILRKESEQYTNALVADLSPALTKVIRQFMDWEHEHPTLAAGIGGITLAVNELSQAFNGLGGVIAGIAGYRILKALGGGGLGIIGRGAGAAISGAGGLAGAGAGRLAMGATPWGLAALAGAAVMHPGSTNDGEADILKQMRAAGRTGPNSLGLPSKSPFFNVFASAVAQRESGGDYSKIGGYNNAYTGKYQMGDGAISDAAHWLREAVPSRSQFLADHAMQERFFKAYTDSNNATLSSSSAAYGNLNHFQRLAALGYAHNQGAGGAASWLKTGVAGRDGFGTDATSYTRDILNGLNQAAQSRSNAANNTTNFHGDIVINTQAKDADGIAKAFNDRFNPRSILAVNSPGLQ